MPQYNFWFADGVYYRQRAQVPSPLRKDAVKHVQDVSKQSVLDLLNQAERQRVKECLDEISAIGQEISKRPFGCSGQQWDPDGPGTIPCPQTGCQDCLD